MYLDVFVLQDFGKFWEHLFSYFRQKQPRGAISYSTFLLIYLIFEISKVNSHLRDEKLVWKTFLVLFNAFVRAELCNFPFSNLVKQPFGPGGHFPLISSERTTRRQHDTETPDPVQTPIPSHTGIKYLVRGIPPSDHIPRLRPIGGRDFKRFSRSVTVYFE